MELYTEPESETIKKTPAKQCLEPYTKWSPKKRQKQMCALKNIMIWANQKRILRTETKRRGGGGAIHRFHQGIPTSLLLRYEADLSSFSSAFPHTAFFFFISSSACLLFMINCFWVFCFVFTLLDARLGWVVMSTVVCLCF